VLKSYYNHPEAADRFTDDGWFRTGDLGVIDELGYLTVTGRLKDVIIRSGEKISARELEKALTGHPAVDAVAVIAVPDARTGERVCACIVPRPNATVTVEAVDQFLLAAGYSQRKLPEQVELLDALPSTAAGKVDKQALRTRFTRR
jgi:non-ribosomal peptide synthetase component E (peptide arylation enzyme)